MQSDYTIRVVKSEDKEIQAVLDFRRKYFVSDLPINLHTKDDGTKKSTDEHWIKVLREGISLLALDDSGEIIGILINTLMRRGDIGIEVSDEDKPVSGILKLIMHLRREDRLWEILPKGCDTVMEIDNCAVHSEWRGRGIMTALCREAEQLALSTGVSALRMEAVSAYAAMAAEKLGFKMIYRLPYKDQNYVPIPDPPHLEARVYIKELGLK